MTALRSAPIGSLAESRLDRIAATHDTIQAEQARLREQIADLDRSGEVQQAGYTSTAALLRHRLGISSGEASRLAAEARGLRDHPEIATAFASAEIDLPRVRLLLDAACVSDRLFERDAGVLIDTVARTTMRDAIRVIAYWKQHADQRMAEADTEHLHERRHLNVSQTIGGMVRIDGELDPDGGQVVLTALHSLADRGNLDPDDTRSPAQRRADALVDLCSDHLDHGDTPVSGQMRPHVSVIVSTHALEGHAADPSEYEDGTVMTPRTARRIACDSTVTRIVMGPDSMPHDVGRATRTIPPAIRTALVARDRHCQWTGCDRPARWCDAHHLEHWADGGPTALDNVVLLCRRHHRMTHHDAPVPQRE